MTDKEILKELESKIVNYKDNFEELSRLADICMIQRSKIEDNEAKCGSFRTTFIN